MIYPYVSLELKSGLLVEGLLVSLNDELTIVTPALEYHPDTLKLAFSTQDVQQITPALPISAYKDNNINIDLSFVASREQTAKAIRESVNSIVDAYHSDGSLKKPLPKWGEPDGTQIGFD